LNKQRPCSKRKARQEQEEQNKEYVNITQLKEGPFLTSFLLHFLSLSLSLSLSLTHSEWCIEFGPGVCARVQDKACVTLRAEEGRGERIKQRRVKGRDQANKAKQRGGRGM
jgi:hypothetical protein